MMQIKYNLDNIDTAAADFWKYAAAYRIWALQGGLGAGKTTFVGALCRYLDADKAVSSPTFSLINEYHFTDASGRKTVIYHSDWYRLADTEEAIHAGMEDMLQQPGAYCIVEWPERAPDLLPSDTLYVHFGLVSETERVLTVSLKEA